MSSDSQIASNKRVFPMNFRRKTVAGVMSAFTKTIADLEIVAENNDQIASNLQVEQERIATDMKDARTEADSARAISKKLSAILNAD